MLGDKDIKNSLSALSKEVDHWYVGQIIAPRAAESGVMFECLRQQITKPTVSINCFDNVSEAFKIASQQAELNDLIIVFGSFYTVAEIRQLLLSNAGKH